MVLQVTESILFSLCPLVDLRRSELDHQRRPLVDPGVNSDSWSRGGTPEKYVRPEGGSYRRSPVILNVQSSPKVSVHRGLCFVFDVTKKTGSECSTRRSKSGDI